MKKQNLMLLGLAGASLIGITLLSKNQPISQQAYSFGGAAIIDFIPPDIVQDPATGTITLPINVTIYPGGGWDNICYYNLLGIYIIEKNTQMVYTGWREIQFNMYHDADTKNRPFTYYYSPVLNISGLPAGRYSIVIREYLSRINDTPYNGDCKSKAAWDAALAMADATYNFETNPKQWLETLGAQEAVAIVAEKTTDFIIQGVCTECPPCEECPPVSCPACICNPSECTPMPCPVCM